MVYTHGAALMAMVADVNIKGSVVSMGPVPHMFWVFFRAWSSTRVRSPPCVTPCDHGVEHKRTTDALGSCDGLDL